MKNKYLIAGILLLSAALCLSVYNLWDANRAAKSTETALGELEQLLPEISEEAPSSDPAFTPESEIPAVEIHGKRYIGRLDIPSLELSLPVMENWSLSNLKLAPCRYQGSAYLGNLIIAAHNYPGHFGDLWKLDVGDGLSFTDMEGNRFEYEVAAFERLGSAAVEEMEAGKWEMTLFTCTASGRNRLTLRCTEAGKGSG